MNFKSVRTNAELSGTLWELLFGGAAWGGCRRCVRDLSQTAVQLSGTLGGQSELSGNWRVLVGVTVEELLVNCRGNVGDLSLFPARVKPLASF